MQAYMHRATKLKRIILMSSYRIRLYHNSNHLFCGMDQMHATQLFLTKLRWNFSSLGTYVTYSAHKIRMYIIWRVSCVRINERAFNFFSNAPWAYVVSRAKVVFLQMTW